MGNTCYNSKSNNTPSSSVHTFTKKTSLVTMNPITLVYWNLHGRSDFAQAMLYAGNIPFDLDEETANAWPASKDDTPFGQIPVLKHGELVVIGQGGAITRYCARLAGLYPCGYCEGDDAEEQAAARAAAAAAAVCDMYLEEMMDIFNGIFQVRGIQ
jgi:glutathione S-transferase